MESIKNMADKPAANLMNIRTFFTNVLEMNGEITCSDTGERRGAPPAPPAA